MEGAENNGWSVCVMLLGAHWMAGPEAGGEEDTGEHMRDVNVVLSLISILCGSRLYLL